MTSHLDLIRSAYPGLVWPAVPPEPGALALALQFQLGRSQWLAPELLRAEQFRQIAALLKHAYETVPFYRERLESARFRAGDPVTEAWFTALPVVTRSQVRDAREALHSSHVPPAHAPVIVAHTSGSTGTPITCLHTSITETFFRAFNLRDQLWHRRDLGLKLAAIRSDRDVRGEQGMNFSGWGPATTSAYRDGAAALLHSTNSLERQLEWLSEQDPAYMLTLGGNLLELAREMHRRGIRLPQLREAQTYGDALSPEARAECRALLGVRVVDIYSSVEAGFIALQCPDHDVYHVQSEGILVEILDESGRHCPAGAIGRVVLTTLHNFAMPLIRYEIGDYVEAGAPCACGRGLPVIRRVLGRERNLAMAPDGRRFYPSFMAGKWVHIAPLRQMQLVQKTRLAIEARIVASRSLDPAEERALAAGVQETLGHPYEITIVRVERIARSPSGKYEDFIREPSVC